VQATEPAAVKHERRNCMVAVEVVNAEYDYFVVSSRRQLFHTALEPRASPFEQHGPVVGRAPAEVREAVAVPSAQLPACPPQPRSLRQRRPRSRGTSDTDEHHGGLERHRREGTYGNALGPPVQHGRQGGYAGGEGTKDPAEQEWFQRVSQSHRTAAAHGASNGRDASNQESIDGEPR